jgi:hypothetical protein
MDALELSQRRAREHAFLDFFPGGAIKMPMLKNTTATLMTGLIISSFAGFSAEAREKHSVKRTSSTTEAHSVTYHQSAPERDRSGGVLGVGFSTLTGAVPSATGAAALTATYELTDKDLVQALFSIPSTSPFQLGGAAFYKRTLFGNHETGFHAGAGFGLGAVNSGGVTAFAFNIAGLAGFHFSIPGLSQVRFHLDGGPSFNFQGTSFGSSSQFQLSALSSALGASVVYIF